MNLTTTINSTKTSHRPPLTLPSLLEMVRRRHQDSWTDFLKQYFPLIFLAGLATLADMLSTCYFMSLIGPQAEVHPLIRLAAEIFGPILGPIIGKTCQFTCLLLASFYFTRYAVAMLASATVLYSLAAWFNFFGEAVAHSLP